MGRFRIYAIRFLSVFLILSCLSGLNVLAENTDGKVSITAIDSSGLDTVETGVPITYSNISFSSSGVYTLKIYAQTQTTAKRDIFISIDGGEGVTLQINGSKYSPSENSYDNEFTVSGGEHDITFSTEDDRDIYLSKIEFTLKKSDEETPPPVEEPTGPSESVTIQTGKNNPEITLINQSQYNGESAIILNTGRSVEFTPNVKSGQCEITVSASNWNYGATPTVTNLNNNETASFTIVKTGDSSGTAEARNFTASATVNIVSGDVLRIADGGNDWKLFSVTVRRIGNFSLKDNTYVNFSAYSEKNNITHQDGYIVLNDGGSISFVYDCENVSTYLMNLTVQGESGASLGVKINEKEVCSYTLEDNESTEKATDVFSVQTGETTLVLYSKNGNVRINEAVFSEYVPQKELEKQIVKLSKNSSDIVFGPVVSPYTGDNYVLFTSDETYVTFNSLLQSGNYKLSVKGGNSAAFNRKIKIQNMSDETVYTFTITPDATLSNQKIFEYASDIYINSGDEFKIYGGDGGVGLSQLILTYIPDDFKLLSVYIGEAYLDVTDSVNRSSDTITLYFNNLVDETSVKDNISVTDTDNTKNISYDFSVSENKVELYLKDTLEFGCNYEIKINDLKSLNNKLAEVTTKNFCVSSTDDTQKNTVVETKEFSLNYGKGTLEGKILGSHGQSISGRNVQIYVYPDNLAEQKILIHSQKSNEEGGFKCDIDFDSLALDCKKYDFLVTTEYSDGLIVEDKAYVSETFEQQIFSDLKGTQTEADTKKFFTQDYKDFFTFDTEKDVEGLNDDDAFYKQFTGLEFDGSVLEFEKYYQKILLYVKLDMTTDTAFVNSVITDAQKCELLGVDYSLISLIVNNKDGFINDLIGMPKAENIGEYVNSFNKALMENYKKEINKTDSTPVVSQKQVTLGQGISVALTLDTAVSDLKKITFVVEASEAKLLENNNFTSYVSGTANSKLNANMITVEITTDEKLNNIKDFGVLNLTAGLTGNYSFNIYGEVLYSVGGYDVKTNIIKTPFSVNVADTSVQQGGGLAGTSSTLGKPSSTAGGSSSSGGGESSSQIKEPSDDNKPDTAEKIYFDDIKSVQWAEESINELTERNIISKDSTMKFRPYDYITREEVVKLIICSLSLKSTSDDVVFEDMQENAWYCRYISVAVNSGIINGYNEKDFGIGDYITREDLATIIHRVIIKLGYEPASESVEEFSDSDFVSDYAKEAVKTVKSMGIVNGMGNNLYMPKDFTTRAQCVKIIYELIKAVGL